MTFPTAVNVVQGIGVAGDFGSSNPRASLDAGPNQIVAGVGGLTVGRFAWTDATGTTALNAGTGPVAGFVGRQQQADISAYLAATSNVIQAGRGVTLYTAGDFLVTNTNLAGDSVIDQKVFASITNGSVRFAAAATVIAGYVETKWVAQSIGSVGELVKITTWTRG